MRLTVLGKSPAWQDAGGACSGYLVELADVAVLLDCGHGVFAKLRRFREPGRLDAVVLSHLHPDHISDLLPYAYALTVAPKARQRAGPRLLVPPGGLEVLRALEASLSVDGLLAGAFELEAYDPPAGAEIGLLRLTFQAVPHYAPTWAISVQSDDRRLVYGADCGPSGELVAFARDVDLLVLEATLAEPEPERPRGHLSAREAGLLARRAGARRLVLTHFSDELDRLATRREGAAGFGAPVELAREGAVFVA